MDHVPRAPTLLDEEGVTQLKFGTNLTHIHGLKEITAVGP